MGAPKTFIVDQARTHDSRSREDRNKSLVVIVQSDMPSFGKLVQVRLVIGTKRVEIVDIAVEGVLSVRNGSKATIDAVYTHQRDDHLRETLVHRLVDHLIENMIGEMDKIADKDHNVEAL